jgi:hypothetical protein
MSGHRHACKPLFLLGNNNLPFILLFSLSRLFVVVINSFKDLALITNEYDSPDMTVSRLACLVVLINSFKDLGSEIERNLLVLPCILLIDDCWVRSFLAGMGRYLRHVQYIEGSGT